MPLKFAVKELRGLGKNCARDPGWAVIRNRPAAVRSAGLPGLPEGEGMRRIFFTVIFSKKWWNGLTLREVGE